MSTARSLIVFLYLVISFHHAHPLETMYTSPETMPPGTHAPPMATIHATPGNHACPLLPAIMHAPSNHACPQQPHIPPGNQACPLGYHAPPPPTMHAPLQPRAPQQPCMPPCEQNHTCLRKHNLAPTSLRAVTRRHFSQMPAVYLLRSEPVWTCLKSPVRWGSSWTSLVGPGLCTGIELEPCVGTLKHTHTHTHERACDQKQSVGERLKRRMSQKSPRSKKFWLKYILPTRFLSCTLISNLWHLFSFHSHQESKS